MEANAVRSVGVSVSEDRAKTVLVVEDELLVRMFISDALRDAGYTVLEAIDGNEAVEVLKSGALIDLVFSDVRMPGSIDGLGLLALIRRTYPALPVVITSGHLQPALAFADGATEFLPKPYQVEQALAVIESELAKAR